MPSNIISTYLARGTKASLSSAPNVGTNDTAVQASTDTGEAFIFNGTSMMPVALLTRPLFPTLSQAAITNASGVTLTAAQLLGGIILRGGASSVVTDTTDSAANIVAAIPSCYSAAGPIGSSFRVRVQNNDNFAKTIAPGSGVTLTGATSIGANSNVLIDGLVTNSTSGSQAVTLFIPPAPGVANGLATLNSSGQLTASQIPASLVGAVVYEGTWNASTNSPALASGTGTKGYYYVVATAGTTTLDGISTWNVGDWAIFNGAAWNKIDGIASEVLSFNARTGAITLTSSDVTTALGYTPLAPANNLSDLTSAPTARTNLGAGAANGLATLDSSGRLTALQIPTINLPLSGSAGTLTIGAAITNVPFDLSRGPGSCALPAAGTANREVRIFDLKGFAATNNLTITVADGGTMSGATSVVFGRPYATNTFLDNGTSWTIIA